MPGISRAPVIVASGTSVPRLALAGAGSVPGAGDGVGAEEGAVAACLSVQPGKRA
jgi:hypothetical protein